MRDVREVSATPVAGDFRNDGGTPIVVDTVNQVAYAIDASDSVFQIGGGAGGGPAIKGSGTYTQNTGTVEFANSNGLTFGLSNNGKMTASHNGLTTARASNDGIGLNTAATQVTWTVNSSGISLNAGAYLTTAMASNAGSNFAGLGETTGTTAGTDLKMTVDSVGVNVSFPKWITTAAASDHSHGNPQLNLTNLSGTTASNSAGFTLSLSAAAPGAGGGAAISAGANSQNTGTVNFANSNGVTFGLSNNGTMTASHNGLTTARASNDGVGLNTALTAGPLAWTVNSGGISLNAGSAAGTSTGFTGANISGSMTNNTAGIALSLSAAAPGGGAGNTVSYYANARQFMNSQTVSALQSTSHLLPFVVDQNVSFDYIRLAMSGSVLAASSTAATTGNISYSAGHFRSNNFVIYSQGAGANSLSLQYVTSAQATEAFLMTQSHAANSTQHSYTLNYTFPCSSGTSGFTKNYSSSAASLNYHTSHLTDLTGLKIRDFQFAGSLSPGRYWLAWGVSSTTSTARTADQSRQGIAFTAFGMSANTLAFGLLGSATNYSIQPFMAHGAFTTAGGGTTSSLPMTRVTSTASHIQLFFQLMRVT